MNYSLVCGSPVYLIEKVVLVQYTKKRKEKKVD